MAAALAVSAHAQPVPTLQIVHANSGTTSGLAPVCTAGVPDALNRGCTGASESGVPASAGTVITGDGHATHPGHGLDRDGSAWATFGSLGAYAQTVATSVDGFYNVQSRAASRFNDDIVATNTSNAAVATYQYLITVHGSLSPWVGAYGTYPYGVGSAYVGFNASALTTCPGCVSGAANWSSESGQVASTLLSGTFSMVTGTRFGVELDLDTSSYINLFAGQSAAVTADYGHTVTL